MGERSLRCVFKCQYKAPGIVRLPVSLWFLGRFHPHAERDLRTVLLSIVAFNTEKLLRLLVDSTVLSLTGEREMRVTAPGSGVRHILPFPVSGA